MPNTSAGYKQSKVVLNEKVEIGVGEQNLLSKTPERNTCAEKELHKS